ncbi:MAG: uracil phosphoribosyltransferase [Candidatus Bathyarchaeota archaeon BA1]|nr:MAG: uracil phosphoribosyltransferase [Candidatus Bathyarchaeota archaeon BA1]
MKIFVAESSKAKECVDVIRRSVSRERVAQSSVVLGKELALDVVNHVGIEPKGAYGAVVKYRDGLFAAYGLKQVFPNLEIVYVKTRRYGRNYENVEVIPLTHQRVGHADCGFIIDPMVARGTTFKGLLDHYVGSSMPTEAMVAVHFIMAKSSVPFIQETLDRYILESYIQTAELHDSVNGHGWLIPGLLRIKDYGDKVFGTWGQDYPLTQEIEYVRSMLSQPEGVMEAIRGITLYLILRLQRGATIPMHRRSLPSLAWITNSLRYAEVKTGLRLIQDWEDNPRSSQFLSRSLGEITHDLAHEDFIEVGGAPFRTYKLTKEGERYTTEVYLPSLAETETYGKMTHMIAEETDFLAEKRPWELYRKIKRMGP